MCGKWDQDLIHFDPFQIAQAVFLSYTPCVTLSHLKGGISFTFQEMSTVYDGQTGTHHIFKGKKMSEKKQTNCTGNVIFIAIRNITYISHT